MVRTVPSPKVPDWFEADDPHLTAKMRQVAEIAAAQRQLGPAVEKAVAQFLAQAAEDMLAERGAAEPVEMDQWPDTPVWQAAVAAFVLGALAELFRARFAREARGDVRVDVDTIVDAYLDQVWQRLARWPDKAFAVVRRAYDDAVASGIEGRQLADLMREVLRIDAPSPGRRAQMRRLEATIADPNASDRVRRQARQRLATLRRADHRRGMLWWPFVAELTRSQAVSALNAGTAEGADAYAEASGLRRFKVWWSAEDHRVRPAHHAAHGQVQPTGQRFLVGGFPMRFPGDPLAPPDLTLNCRCSLLSVSEKEAARIQQRSTAGEEGMTMGATTAATAPPDAASAAEEAVLAAISAEGEVEPSDGTEPVLADGEAVPEEETVVRWRGVLAPLGRRSPDGRVLAEPQDGQVLHRSLPLPLLYQEKSSSFGHDGSVIVGNIEQVWVQDGNLMGEGSFDLGNDTAREVVRQIAGGFHRWVSITHDPDADYSYRFYRDGVEISYAEAAEAAEHEVDGSGSSIVSERVASNWRLSDATLVSQPAFEHAQISLVDDDLDDENDEDEDDLDDDDEVRRRRRDLDEHHAGFAVSAEKRRRAEKSGAAMDGGRYPIETKEDLRNAIHAVGRARPNTDAERAKVRRHIMKRARALGLTDLIPDSWNSDGSLSEGKHAVVASGAAWAERVATAVPLEPPPSWFSNPQLTGATKIRITDEGRIYGHIAAWGTEHASHPGITPPRAPGEGVYAKFHRHPVRCADGSRIKTGPLATGGHADIREQSIWAVMRHYDDPSFVVADVVCGEDAHGIWVSGALRPGVTPLQVIMADRYSFSGDWRDGELVAACSVSVPGFHLDADDAVRALAASGEAAPVVLAEAVPQVRRDGGEIVAVLSAGLLPPTLPKPSVETVSPSAVQMHLDPNPEQWGERVGRGMFAGLRAAEEEARRRAEQERVRREKVAEFRRRIGPPPVVRRLQQRVMGSQHGKVGV